MNGRQVQQCMVMLTAVFGSTVPSPETLALLRQFFGRLEIGIAEATLWHLIETTSQWPTIHQISKDYDARVIERRRRADEEQERRERIAADVEPTDDERRRTLEHVRRYVEQKWGTP